MLKAEERSSGTGLGGWRASMKEHIGFIGLAIMGWPMGRNLPVCRLGSI